MQLLISKALSTMYSGWEPSKFGWAVQKLVRDHVQSKYPGSKHWSPDKINLIQAGSSGIDIDIDIPGASRAYHDVDIYPRNGSWLAIPLLPLAKGISPRDQEDLFRPWRKGGREKMNVLAKKNGSGLVFMYALSKHVHQRQDTSLLPSDEQIVETFAADFAEQAQSMDY